MKFKYGPYSPSRLDTGVCGYSFHKQYIDPNRVRPREGLAQGRGSAVHEIFEKITAKMIESQTPSFNDKQIREWVIEAVNKHPIAYEEVDEIIKMAKLYIRRPPPLLTSDAEIELRLAVKIQHKEDGSPETYMDDTIFEGQLVERIKFVACDYDDPEAIARGRADVLFIMDDTTTAMIYDHKTQPNVEEADTFQLGFYAWVISKTYPFLNEIRTVLHFARYGTFSEPYIWNARTLYDIEDAFLTRAGIIESKQVWDATPHDKCQYCPFLMECPALKEFIEVDDSGNVRVLPNNLKILGSTQKAVQIAGLINVLEEVLKTSKAALKDYVTNVGGIAIPGKIYEFRGEEKIDWDRVNKMKLDVYEVFKKHSVDPRMFMGFSATHSKMIWMTENEGLVKELAELFPRTTETTFKGYKG